MADLSKALGGPWTPPPEKRIDPPEVQLRDAMISAGLTPPDDIYMDGKVHRFKSGTKGSPGKGDKPGWYLVFGDGVPAGRFGCWRSGLELPWRADVGRKLTQFEEMAHAKRMAEAKALRDAELERKHEVAAMTVSSIWEGAQTASPDHQYLKRKGIDSHGARVTSDGRLVVPLYNADNQLASLQYIDAEGGKLYHPGGKTGGNFWVIGTMDEPGVVYIAEGFATAATIFEVTGRPCVVAYSASNVVPVTGLMREKLGPRGEIVIVADNDSSGVGKKYAEQASIKHGARVIIPPIEGMDANDFVQAGHDLTSLLYERNSDGVVDRLKVVFGDELGGDYEIPDELVEGLMTIGSSIVVYGDSNSGKTFWALSVATAIATGSDCYGRKTDPGLVIYLASEAPSSIRTRMQAIKRFYKCGLENLAMVPVPMNFYEGDQDANDVIELVRQVEEIKGQPVRLIIGDTLARMSAGANENSGEDMGPVMARFDQVATATGSAMMIIHHNGKDTARGARGWSGIRAHIDTEIEVVEKDGIRSASVTKQRELPSKGDTIYFKLEVMEMGQTKFGSVASTCVAVPDDEAEQKAPHKKPTKHDENIRLIERAWAFCEMETRDGLPYISRSGLKNFLVTNMGLAERTAKNKTEASRSNSIVHQLLNAEVIEPDEHGNGWVVIDDVQVSAFMMRKNEKRK